MSSSIAAYDPAVDAPAHHHPVYDYDSGPPVNRGKFAIWLFLGDRGDVLHRTDRHVHRPAHGARPFWPDPERSAQRVDVTALEHLLPDLLVGFTMVKAVEKSPWSGDCATACLLKWLGLTIVIGTMLRRHPGLRVPGAHRRTARIPSLDIFYSTFYAMTGFHGTARHGRAWSGSCCVWLAAS